MNKTLGLRGCAALPAGATLPGSDRVQKSMTASCKEILTFINYSPI
ncbi:MAG: hypothetical protein ACREEM_46950 [Blastocatellia bacterium]